MMLSKAASSASLSPSIPTTRVPIEVIPLAGAFLVIAFAFGVLARESGLDFWLTFLMSALVYAGTSQVVALGLIMAGQSPWVIILVTLLINARFFLLGSVLAEYVHRWKPLSRMLFAFQLTDETFALLLTGPDSNFNSSRRATWIQCGAYLSWIVGTALGFAVGADTSQLRGIGLDFALVAMMLAVLVLQIHNWRAVAVAVVGGSVAMLCVRFGLGWCATLAAAFVAPAVGVWLDRRWKTRKSF